MKILVIKTNDFGTDSYFEDIESLKNEISIITPSEYSDNWSEDIYYLKFYKHSYIGGVLEIPFYIKKHYVNRLENNEAYKKIVTKEIQKYIDWIGINRNSRFWQKFNMKLIKRKLEFDKYGNGKTNCLSFCPKDSSKVFSLPVKRYSDACGFNCKYYYAHNRRLEFILCKKDRE